MLREQTPSVVLGLDQHLAPKDAKDICRTHHLLLGRLHVWTMQRGLLVQSEYPTSQTTAENLDEFLTYNAIQEYILSPTRQLLFLKSRLENRIYIQ